MKFGLPQKTITYLKSVFEKYSSITQVKIYGSRAIGNYRKGSDIDLAFFSESSKDLSANLSWDLDDLPIPYMFDVVNYNLLGDNPLKQEIDKYGKVFYTKKNSSSTARKHRQVHCSIAPAKEEIHSKKNKHSHKKINKTKKQKPKTPHNFKQTEIGEIPEHWEVMYLESMCKAEYGFTDRARDSGDTRFIRITDIGNTGQIREKNKKFINLSQNSRKYLLQKGDLLVARVGATFGKTTIFDKEYPSVFASYLIRLNFSNNSIFPMYYWFFSQSKLYWNQAYNLVTGGTKPQFNSNVIKQIKIPVPPLSEQKEIAGVLSQIQKAIEVQDQLIESTEELKKSTMKQLFTYGVRGQKTKQTEIGEIPEHWEIHKLCNVCHTSSGGTPLKSKVEYYKKGTIPWLRSGEVRQNIINKSELFITEKGLKESSAKLFPSGTVLIAMYGATAGQIGLLKFQSAINQAICGVSPTHRIHTEFLFFFLISIRKYISNFAIGCAQPNISQTIIKNIKIPVPSFSEQKEIAEILSKIDEQIKVYRDKKSNLEELFKTMLSKLMTGKIRIYKLKRII